MSIKTIKTKEPLLFFSAFVCLLFSIVFAVPVRAVNEDPGQADVTLVINDYYDIKIKCPKHSKMYINGEGPYSAGQEITKQLFSWQNIHVEFVPEDGYKLKSFEYGADADATMSGNSIDISNLKASGHLSATMERIDSGNPTTFDDLQSYAWILGLAICGLGLLTVAGSSRERV